MTVSDNTEQPRAGGARKALQTYVIGSANWLISFSLLVGPNALAAARFFIGAMIAATLFDRYSPGSLDAVMMSGGNYPLNDNAFILALSSSELARSVIY